MIEILPRIGFLGGLFILGVMIFFIALGGLISSTLNRRMLEKLRAEVQHGNRNAKMAREAIAAHMKKQDDRDTAAGVVVVVAPKGDGNADN